MTRRAAFCCGAAALGFLGLAACASAPPRDRVEDNASSMSEVTSRDWLEGAYEKQGGTKLFAVFRRNEEGSTTSGGTFFGEVDVNGRPQRAEGTFVVTRDNLGTVISMNLAKTAAPSDAGPSDASTRLEAGVHPSDAGTKPSDAGVAKDAGATDLTAQAFSGRLHFLKIGKNDTILVRADATGKTGHYTKIDTWCGTKGAADCAEAKQRTGLSCTARVCSAEHACGCANAAAPKADASDGDDATAP